MPVTAVRLARSRNGAGELVVRLGVPLLDEYLEFLAGRCRPNTVLAVAYDLKVFFTVVGKPPRRVRPSVRVTVRMVMSAHCRPDDLAA
jgi:integrase/recombinase XerD